VAGADAAQAVEHASLPQGLPYLLADAILAGALASPGQRRGAR